MGHPTSEKHAASDFATSRPLQLRLTDDARAGRATLQGPLLYNDPKARSLNCWIDALSVHGLPTVQHAQRPGCGEHGN
eukprot:14158800-Alexandrium_andersonii.AAC.1